MSVTRRGPRPDLRLDVPVVEAPDHLAEQWAALARASVPTPTRRVVRPAVAVGVAAGVGLLSVGGAWAGGAISLPLVPDSPLVSRPAEKSPAPSEAPSTPRPSAPQPGATTNPTGTEPDRGGTSGSPDEHAADRAKERAAERGPGQKSSRAPGQVRRSEGSIGPDREKGTGGRSTPPGAEKRNERATEKAKPRPPKSGGEASQGTEPRATPRNTPKATAPGAATSVKPKKTKAPAAGSESAPSPSTEGGDG